MTVSGRTLFDDLQGGVESLVAEAPMLDQMLAALTQSLVDGFDLDDTTQFQQGALIAVSAARVLRDRFGPMLTGDSQDALAIYVAQGVHWELTK